MAEYFITGVKGSGKSLSAVGRMVEYLNEGNRVATNLDLYLLDLLPKHCKNTNAVRVPDYPCLRDLQTIGIGNPTIQYEMTYNSETDSYEYELFRSADFDESKNGLLVFDELATWMNARSYQDKKRQPVLDWLVHARKLGWDILYIVQDLEMVDKQARRGFAEHVVYCKRLDRVNVPVVGFLWSIISGKKLPLPRVHVGVVKYGYSPSSLTVDRWVYRGNHLFQGYNTLQKFNESYDIPSFSYLPNWHVKGRFSASRDLRFIMNLTKIYFRQYSRVFSFVAGVLVSIFLFVGSVLYFINPDSAIAESGSIIKTSVQDLESYSLFRIQSMTRLPGKTPFFVLEDPDGDQVTSVDLVSQGYAFKIYDRSKLKLLKGGNYVTIYN